MPYVAPKKHKAENIPCIVDRLNKGESTLYSEAKAMGVHPATVSGWRRKYMGEEFFDLRKLSKLTEDRDIILELAECISIIELAEKFDVDHGTMRNFINKHKPKPEVVNDGLRETTLSEIHNGGIALDGETYRLKRRQRMNYIMVPEDEYLQLKSNTTTK